jgi:hypothetical protein
VLKWLGFIQAWEVVPHLEDQAIPRRERVYHESTLWTSFSSSRWEAVLSTLRRYITWLLNTITNDTAPQRKKLRNDLPSTFHLRSLTLLYLVFRSGISRLWRRVDIRLFLGCDTLHKTEVWCLRNVACHTLMFLPTHCRFFSCLFRLPNAHARQH